MNILYSGNVAFTCLKGLSYNNLYSVRKVKILGIDPNEADRPTTVNVHSETPPGRRLTVQLKRVLAALTTS